MVELVTCSFGEYLPSMGAPIRTSRGTPRWFQYPLPLAWDNIMPDGWMLNIEDEMEYRRTYFEKLNRIGLDTLKGDADYLASQWQRMDGRKPDRLVLMCYEKLSKPGNWCHRTMFADWWEMMTEQFVGEFGALPTEPEPGPPTLF